MSVYLGNYGFIELRRKSGSGVKSSTISASDVNVTRRRFSFDFDTGFLNSGDRIEIKNTSGGLLDFVAASGWGVNEQQSAGSWYINVDELGGLRLYSSLDGSLRGELSDAIELESIANDIPIEVRIENDTPNILAQCTYFELNTNRDVIDTTVLGDEFRTQFASIISGSGQFRAYWDYLPLYTKNQLGENAHYILQLAIRTEVGSEFAARFYLKGGNYSEGGPNSYDDRIWYEVEGVISQAGVNFSADSTVEITADFVTTGSIKLLTQTVTTDKILQEDTGDIRLEQDSAASLLQESND